MVADNSSAATAVGSFWQLPSSCALTRVYAAVAAAAAVLLSQGESDAVNLVTATAYGTHFTTWLAATRAALQPYNPCTPLVMAVMATRKRQGAFPFIDVVAEQQWALKLPRLLKVDMAGYEFYDGGDGNLVHLTKAGCCALGAAMAFEVAACCTN